MGHLVLSADRKTITITIFCLMIIHLCAAIAIKCSTFAELPPLHVYSAYPMASKIMITQLGYASILILFDWVIHLS